MLLQSVVPLSAPGSGVPITAACHSAFEGSRLRAFSHAACAWNQVSDADGAPLPGFRFEDCRPISADSLAAPVEWTKPLATLRGQAVRLEFALRGARLFAFETR